MIKECKCGRIAWDGDLCVFCKNKGVDFGYEFSHIGIHFSEGLYKPFVHGEYWEWDNKSEKHRRAKVFCEYGSVLAEKFFNDNPSGRKLYKRISFLLNKFQAFLLGKEGMKRYLETEMDRKLVTLLRQGAQMDMDTGKIIDPFTGEEI